MAGARRLVRAAGGGEDLPDPPVDPDGQGRRYANALQEHHHLFDRLLLGPGSDDHRGPLGTEAVHLDQAARLVLDDVHDVDAEVADHALGHHRADALDQARTQVPLDALHRGRQHDGVGEHLELLAVLRMGCPPAAHPQALAYLSTQQRPDRRDQVRAAAARVDPGDHVPGLRVGEGDPLQDPVEDGSITMSFRRG
jgi:hypothetical protein